MYQVHVVDLNPILPLSSRRRLVPPRRKDTSVSELAKQSHNPNQTIQINTQLFQNGIANSIHEYCKKSKLTIVGGF